MNEEHTAILAKMRELLSSKERWTQGAFARDTSGGSVDLDDPDAVCFCLVGAHVLARHLVTGIGYHEELDPWVDDRRHERFPDMAMGIVAWNDHPTTTYEDIIAFLTE